jgi:hypothetical protein
MGGKMNLEYINKRNSLIPQAVKFANKKCGKGYKEKGYPDRENWAMDWNLKFHGRMTKLAKGIVLLGEVSPPDCGDS